MRNDRVSVPATPLDLGDRALLVHASAVRERRPAGVYLGDGPRSKRHHNYGYVGSAHDSRAAALHLRAVGVQPAQVVRRIVVCPRVDDTTVIRGDEDRALQVI